MNKTQAREHVWKDLIKVARPDSRYHFNFNEFIPDFEGSPQATDRLAATDLYREAGMVFITPDNCLEDLRERVMLDGKTQVISTYGIRRGLVELGPDDAPDHLARYAVLLDVMEETGRYLPLAEIQARGLKFDWMITGASAVNTSGVRFGKGHGFFDLEWAMFYSIGAVDVDTPVIAFVHDCQVVDVDFELSPFDTVCDLIITPTRTIEIDNPQKPTQGVIWDQLEPDMMDEIPLLGELKSMQQD